MCLIVCNIIICVYSKTVTNQIYHVGYAWIMICTQDSSVYCSLTVERCTVEWHLYRAEEKALNVSITSLIPAWPTFYTVSRHKPFRSFVVSLFETHCTVVCAHSRTLVVRVFNWPLGAVRAVARIFIRRGIPLPFPFPPFSLPSLPLLSCPFLPFPLPSPSCPSISPFPSLPPWSGYGAWGTL